MIKLRYKKLFYICKKRWLIGDIHLIEFIPFVITYHFIALSNEASQPHFFCLVVLSVHPSECMGARRKELLKGYCELVSFSELSHW